MTHKEKEKELKEVLGAVPPTGELTPAEEVVQEFADLMGEPTSNQQKGLEGLARLHLSLLGPEHLLDTAGYSRPFPPSAPRPEKRFRPETPGSPEPTFERHGKL